MDAASRSGCNKKHGAVVVVGGRVLAVATNSNRNDPTRIDDPKTQAAVHAEIAALRACGRTRVSGGTIYVARVNKNGVEGMSKPCERCQAALREVGIKKVVYTISSEMLLS